MNEFLLWFFALAGFAVLACDIVRYFMFKNTLPDQMTVLIPAEAVRENAHAGIANLLNLLYEQNPEGAYDIIILDNNEPSELLNQVSPLCDAADCLYIANPQNVAQYLKDSYK